MYILASFIPYSYYILSCPILAYYMCSMLLVQHPLNIKSFILKLADWQLGYRRGPFGDAVP